MTASHEFLPILRSEASTRLQRGELAELLTKLHQEHPAAVIRLNELYVQMLVGPPPQTYSAAVAAAAVAPPAASNQLVAPAR